MFHAFGQGLLDNEIESAISGKSLAVVRKIYWKREEKKAELLREENQRDLQNAVQALEQQIESGTAEGGTEMEGILIFNVKNMAKWAYIAHITSFEEVDGTCMNLPIHHHSISFTYGPASSK